MNESENKLVELKELGGHRNLLGGVHPGYTDPTNQVQDHIFLNDSLRSRSFADQSEDDLSLDNGDGDDEALLDHRLYPNPDISGLFRILYDYSRFIVAAFLLIWSFVLIFTTKGVCTNGPGALKKLPHVSRLGVIRVRHVRG